MAGSQTKKRTDQASSKRQKPPVQTTNKKTSKAAVPKASTPKKTVNKKTAVKKTNSRAKVQPVMDPEESGTREEVVVAVTFAVSILLILSSFHLCGRLGEMIAHVLFGLFGMLAYIFPFLFFGGVFFHISNRGNKKAAKKLFAVGVAYIFMTAFVQMVSGNYKNNLSVIECFTTGAAGVGGGFIGGNIANGLVKVIASAGSYVVIICVLISSFIVITQKRPFKAFGNKGHGAYKKAVKTHQEKKEQRQEQKKQYVQMSIDDMEVMNTGKSVTADPAKEAVSKAKSEKPVKPESPVEVVDHGMNFDLKCAAVKKEMAEKIRLMTKGQLVTQKNLENPLDGEVLMPLEVVSEDEGLEGFRREAEAETKEDVTAKNKKPESFEIQVTRMEPLPPLDLDEPQSELQIQEKETKEKHLEYKEPEYKGSAHLEHSEAEQPETVREEQMQPSQASQAREVEDRRPGAGRDDFMERYKVREVQAEKEETHEVAHSKNEHVEPMNISQKVAVENTYIVPPLALLKRGVMPTNTQSTDAYLKQTAMKLQNTLDSFGVKVQVTNVSCGPSVTRYEVSPEQGVKVSRIVNLSDDIKLNLAVPDIRIEAPIPGKAAVGIEVPNKENTTVMLRDLLESHEFRNHHSEIAFAAGRDIGGKVIVADIAKMPHLLIAGATGSGKSVCINTLIMSIIYKARPEDVRLIMIDPKVVELSVYNGIPHLLIPVVTDPKKAAGALNWAVMEMTDRYRKFAELNVRDLKGYNAKVEASEYESEEYPRLPQIVIIVDELADLMMVASSEVEDAICRLAQLARAAGIHLVIATQRPSVNVITGVIKANIPSRIAFSVSSGVDSRTIIDMNGAERLLGKGDMLFYPSGYQKPIRVQGAFVSDKEVNDVVEFLKEHMQDNDSHYNNEIEAKIVSQPQGGAGSGERDIYFMDAGKFIIEKDKASIGMLQRVYKIGFNRAARIMDQLYEAGVVGPEEGTKPRRVLMSLEEFEQYVDEYV